MNESSAVAEVFGVGVGIAKTVVDENRGLAGQFESLTAFVARHEVVQADHVRGGLRKFSFIFLTDAARQFPFLPADLPTYRRFELTAAARANELDLAGLFFFVVELALVHI